MIEGEEGTELTGYSDLLALFNVAIRLDRHRHARAREQHEGIGVACVIDPLHRMSHTITPPEKMRTYRDQGIQHPRANLRNRTPKRIRLHNILF
jgi:hypothetical protein